MDLDTVIARVDEDGSWQKTFDFLKTSFGVVVMCTSIVEIVNAEGKGKDGNARFKLNQAVVCYDHPHHALLDEAITIDFMNMRGLERAR